MVESRWFKWLVGLVAGFGALAIGFGWWMMLELRPVDSSSSETVSYVLPRGTDLPEMADQLQGRGLIRSANATVIYATLTGKRGELKAGTYDLQPSQTAPEIISLISGGQISANKLVVADGLTMAQFQKLAISRGVNKDDLVSALKANYDYDFIKARPAGATLEGYLYPDTYQLNKPVKASVLVRSMLDNFAQKLSGTDIPARYAAMGLSLHQGITLASIVEKEVPGDADRAMVAQVYLNRLKAGMPLQADPTVSYVAEATGTDFNIQVNSPYNTYAYKGLPPGPINSPSLSAMKAVAHPTANDYLYFIADKQGKTHYAKTFAEHQKNVETYLK